MPDSESVLQGQRDQEVDKDLLGLFCMGHCHPLTNRLSVQRHNFAVGKLFRCIDTQVAQAEIVYLENGYSL